MKSCSYLIGVSVFKYNYFISTESKLVIFYYRIFIKVVLIALQEVEILEFDKDNFKIRAVGWVNILDYCRSQSDSKGFSPGTPVFLPQQNWLPAYSQLIPSGCGAVLRGHAWVVFWGRASIWQHGSFGATLTSCALCNSVSDCEKGRLASQPDNSNYSQTQKDWFQFRSISNAD